VPTPRALAWANVAVHLLGLAAAALGMRPGSPLVGLEERMGHLAGRPAAWPLAWGVWMLCALALVAFVHEAAARLPGASLAAPLAAAGAGVDLLCDGVQMAVLPLLASGGADGALAFRAWERAAGVGGLVAANGLYALAVLVVTLSLRGRPGAGPAVAVGWGVFGGGMVLVAAGLTGDAWLAALATPPTIGLFCVWVVLVARALGEAPVRPGPPPAGASTG
jgi:hypothetical protein